MKSAPLNQLENFGCWLTSCPRSSATSAAARRAGVMRARGSAGQLRARARSMRPAAARGDCIRQEYGAASVPPNVESPRRQGRENVTTSQSCGLGAPLYRIVYLDFLLIADLLIFVLELQPAMIGQGQSECLNPVDSSKTVKRHAPDNLENNSRVILCSMSGGGSAPKQMIADTPIRTIVAHKGACG